MEISPSNPICSDVALRAEREESSAKQTEDPAKTGSQPRLWMGFATSDKFSNLTKTSTERLVGRIKPIWEKSLTGPIYTIVADRLT
jgi:hypothetical protein